MQNSRFPYFLILASITHTAAIKYNGDQSRYQSAIRAPITQVRAPAYDIEEMYGNVNALDWLSFGCKMLYIYINDGIVERVSFPSILYIQHFWLPPIEEIYILYLAFGNIKANIVWYKLYMKYEHT